MKSIEGYRDGAGTIDWDAYEADRRRERARREKRLPPLPFKGSKDGCQLCGKPCPSPHKGRTRSWHPQCADRWRKLCNASLFKDDLIARDGEKCRCCGVFPFDWRPVLHPDQHGFCGKPAVESVRQWVRNPAPTSRNDTWLQHRELVGLADGPFTPIFKHYREQLEVDHIVALWTADPNDLSYWEEDNLRLLLESCHKRKTAEDVRRLAKVKRLENRRNPKKNSGPVPF